MRNIGFMLVALLAFSLWGQEVDYDFTAEAEVPSQTSVDIGDVSPGALGRLTVRPDGRAIAVSGWVQCSDGTSWNGGSDELTVEVVFEYGFGTDIVATCDGHDVEGHQCAYWTGADQPGIHNPFFKGRYATTGTAPGQGGEAIWTLIANQEVVAGEIYFVKNNNTAYEEGEALAVSNFVTNLDYQVRRNKLLPGGRQAGPYFPVKDDTDFKAVSKDPDNFRIEVHEKRTTPPDVTISVNGAKGVSFPTVGGGENQYRGPFLRLVSNDEDSKVGSTATV